MIEKTSVKWALIKYDETSVDRDIEDVLKERFPENFDLYNTIDKLHDPYLLADMDKAVKRIKEAKEKDEKVIIFWDYDVDWVTSTAILMHFFKTIWLKASYRLPHRVDDWYWLKDYFVDEVHKLWVTLIVTVDCWTRDTDIIKYAKKLGIDVIVTDHHAVPENLEEGVEIAMINPKRSDCNYVYKNLAWAWVAFKLMQALAKEFLDEDKVDDYIRETIDIAAIWTVADCMMLTWENRIIVTEWLKQIKNSRSRWIRRLIEDKINDELDADLFWFHIWPRLNAAWRMDTAYKAVNLILNNWDSLDKTIREIESLNEERKFLTRQFVEEAMWKVNRKNNIIFHVSKEITHWIIWIVAGRLTETFYKPSIVLKDEWDKLIASCRSPEYYSIIDILEKYKKYFITFWWHKQAAWFSIRREDFTDFRKEILDEVNKLNFKQYKKELPVDKVVKIEEIWFSFLNKINKYKPFWIGNTKPIFIIEKFEYKNVEILGKNSRDHIRFNTKHWFKVFWFWLWEYLEDIKKANYIDLVFDLSEDSWMWKKNIMFKVIDIIIH